MKDGKSFSTQVNGNGNMLLLACIGIHRLVIWNARPFYGKNLTHKADDIGPSIPGDLRPRLASGPTGQPD
jgi:hypothetical protein